MQMNIHFLLSKLCENEKKTFYFNLQTQKEHLIWFILCASSEQAFQMVNRKIAPCAIFVFTHPVTIKLVAYNLHDSMSEIDSRKCGCFQNHCENGFCDQGGRTCFGNIWIFAKFLIGLHRVLPKSLFSRSERLTYYVLKYDHFKSVEVQGWTPLEILIFCIKHWDLHVLSLPSRKTPCYFTLNGCAVTHWAYPPLSAVTLTEFAALVWSVLTKSSKSCDDPLPYWVEPL